MNARLPSCFLLLASGFFVSCGPAINPNAENTFLTADDLVLMTDKMAAAISSDARVNQIRQSTGRPLTIVLFPVQNETNEIIPAGTKRMYVARVRTLLSSQPMLRNAFTFVLNRQDFEALQAQEGVPPEKLGAPVARLVPDYALTGTFYADTNVDNVRRADYYLCTYRLTSIKPDGTAGEILWEDKYETKKAATKAFLD